MPMIAAILVAGSLIAPEAQAVLDQGRWGLIVEDLSESSIARARQCVDFWMEFSFVDGSVSLAQQGASGLVRVPTQEFEKLTWNSAGGFAEIDLYEGADDVKALLTFRYDPSVKSLMRLMPDGDGDALYVLCD